MTPLHLQVAVAGQVSNVAPLSTSFGVPEVTRIACTLTPPNPQSPGYNLSNPALDGAGFVPVAGGGTVTLRGNNFGADATQVVVTWNGVTVDGVTLPLPNTVLQFTSLPGTTLHDGRCGRRQCQRRAID